MRSAYYATICELSLKGEYGILNYNKYSRKRSTTSGTQFWILGRIFGALTAQLGFWIQPRRMNAGAIEQKF